MREREVKEIFNKHDLDGYSRWNVGNGEQYVLPPLMLNTDLRIIKIKEDNLTRIDFRLVLSNGLIVFHETLSGRLFGFDIDYINQDKIHFLVDGEKGVVWTRLSLGTIDDLLSSFQ
jgi:hypothetical protein